MRISKLLWIFAPLFFLSHHLLVNSQQTVIENLSTPLNKPEESEVYSKNFHLAYTISQDSNRITPIDLQTGVTGSPILLEYNPKALVFYPTGQRMYIIPENSNQIIVRELLKDNAQTSMSFENSPKTMIVDSEGIMGYLIYENSKQLTQINLKTGEKQDLVLLSFFPLHMCLTADNQTLYLSSQDTNEITSIHLISGKQQPAIFMDTLSHGLIQDSDGKVASISLDTPHSLNLIKIENSQSIENQKKIDVKTPFESIVTNINEGVAYLTYANSNEVIPIDLVKKASLLPIYLDHKVKSLTLYPRQTLTAAFTTKIAPIGQESYFNASSSQPFRGVITDYFWNFGEGQSFNSSTPFASYTYQKAGIYTVELTVTESMENFPFTEINHESIDKTIPLKVKNAKFIQVKVASETKKLKDNKLLDVAAQILNSTTTTITSSINPSVFGQTVTFTATVTSTGTPTGVVTFYNGASPIGTQPLNASGIATLSISNLGVGSNLITATYEGDITNDISTSSTLTQVVDEANTNTTLTSSVNPSVFGQPITLTATVTAASPGVGIPTGSISFKDTGGVIGTAALVNGVATLVVSNLAIGIHPLSATYVDDTNFLPSTSADLSQTINKANTTTALTSSANPSLFGQPITLTATVAPVSLGAGVPVGTVTFRDGVTNLGTGTLSGGTATFVTSNLSVGAHTLSAVYSGNLNFNVSTSANLTQTVNKGTTTTTLNSNNNPSIFGQGVILTVNVAVATGAGTVTGTVTFRDGATTIGTGTILSGVATLNISNLSVGAHNLTAVYGGDTNFTTSTSPIVNQVVNQGSTSTTLTSSANPSSYGQQVTLTATIAVTQGVGTPTGSVTFTEGAVTLGTGTLNAGVVTLSISNLSVGSHIIVATYSGDVNFTGSNSNLTQIVDRATPLATVTSSLNPAPFSTPITFTALVKAPTVLGTPTGTVNFYEGATLLATRTLVAGGGANTGTANISISNLTSGTQTITITYIGDGNFFNVTSPALSQVVNQDIITTTTVYSNSPNPTFYGQPVTLRANVVGSIVAPAFPPTGTITFKEGATVLGTVPLSQISANTSTATLTISNFSTATHVITAVYSGDVNYPASTSATPLNQQVIPDDTKTVLSTSITPAKVGQTVTFTANVNAQAPGAGNATGAVQFYDGNVLIGTGTLAPNGVNTSTATLAVNSLTLGSHSITAFFNGDTNFNPSTSNTIAEVITQANSAVALTSSLNPSSFGQSITLSAIVSAAAPGSGTPTGTVTFREGATVLGTGTLSGGVATFSTIALYPGTHNLTAVYDGNANYIGAISPILAQVVINTLPTITTITSARNSSPVNQPVTFSAKVTAITGTPTGSVQFFDGGVLFGTGTLVNGVATVTEPAVNYPSSPVTHTITAKYLGDANFDPSDSAAFSQYTVPVNTSVVLTSNGTSTQGGAIFTATVSPAPLLGNGTVRFYENGVLINGTVNFDPVTGIATLAPTDLRFMGRNIQAIYTGDQLIDAQAYSNIITQQVQQTNMLPTATTVASSLTTAYVCQNINLSATVVATQGFYIPTGDVTFYDGTIEIGTAILDVNGVATLPVDTLDVGNHKISATYNSDSNYAFSFSTNTVTITVIANNTTLNLSLLPNLASTPYGQTLLYTAQVTAQFGIATGNVTFTADSTDVRVVPLDASGRASLTINTLSVGSHTMVATYISACCSDCFTSSTGSVTNTVTKAAPALTLSSSANPSLYGNDITLNATVLSSTIGMPTGTVTFFNNSINLGTAILVNGQASLLVKNLPAGVSVVRATYSGDSNFITINFPSFVQTVNKAATVTTLLQYDDNPSEFGQVVTLNAIISSVFPKPTGTVTFQNGVVILGTSSLNGSDTASLDVSNLNLGANNLTATYNGDANFNASTSPVLVSNVVQAPTYIVVNSIVPTPTTYGTSFTLNVSVISENLGLGNPTGTVTAFYGPTVVGTGTLTNGVSSFVVTGVLPAGNQTLILNYSGGVNFTASSLPFTQIINTVASTILLASSANSSVYGQPVNLTTTVNSTGGTPTGTVSFLDGTTTLGTATLNATGAASLVVSNLSVETHSITAVYSGNSNITTSTSTVLSQVVNKSNATAMLVSSTPPSVFGQPVVFTATVGATNPGSGTPTGSINFRNGAANIATTTLNSLGQAAISTSTLPVGINSITVVYAGDTNFNGVTSTNISQQVNKTSTTTSVTSSPNPGNLTSTILLNVTVTPINTITGTPSGTVQAYYGSTLVGTGALNSGTATFGISNLPAGTSDTVVVKYLGNISFLASSATLTQTILQGATTTTLTSSSNPAVYAEPITFTANVGSISGNPTGTISFLDGTTTLGMASLNIGGSASITVSNLSVGSHPITAVYSGNTSFSSSTSSLLTQVVNKAPTTAVLASILNPSFFGEAVILNALVSSNSPSTETPTGTVTFRNGVITIGTATLNNLGQASLSIDNLPIGTQSLTVVYNGNTNFLTSTSTAVNQVVNLAATMITATASPNPVNFNAPVTITANVTPINANTGVSTGTVQALSGSTVVGSGTLTAGSTTFTVTGLPTGTTSLVIKYLGSTNHLPSSTSLTESVNLATAAITLTSSVNPSVFGQPITLTSTVTSVAPVTGTVAFLDGTTALGTGTLNASGTVTLTVFNLSVGTHAITAVYSGNSNAATATSTAISQVVNRANTTAIFSSYSNPSTIGEAVNLRAVILPISPSSGTPTGTVTFQNGATVLGTVTLNNGEALLSLSTLPLGINALTITYNGDTNFNTSTATLNQVVKQSATTITATLTPNPINFGSTTTLNATVAAINTASGIPTGTVNAFYGSTQVGSGTLNSSGVASFTVSNLPAGVSSIVVRYTGDTNFLPSATPVTVTVTALASTTTLTSSANPSVLGQPITLTGTVSTSLGTPTGTLSFFDGTNVLATVALNSSATASVTINNLTVGTHLLTAVYSGSNNAQISTSAILSQVVNKADTVSTVTTRTNPSVFGENVTLSASVVANSPGSGIPTGTVTYKNGAVTIGTATLNNFGQATLTVSNFPVGTQLISIVYNGDQNFNSSTSSIINQVVNKTATITRAILTPNPIIIGEPVSVSVTVQPINIGLGIPSGNVNVLYGSTVLGTGTLDANGQLTLNLNNLPAGNLNLIVEYLGDANFLPSSTSLSETINQVASQTTITSSVNPTVFGQDVIFSAIVTSDTGTLTGFVTFLDGNTTIGTSLLNISGIALLTVNDLAVGSHSITAVYNGNEAIASSSSDAVVQIVGLANTLTRLTSSENPSFFGNAVTFFANVSATSPGLGTPTNTVTFRNGTTVLGTVPVNDGGLAILSLIDLPVGTNTVTATYNGDTNFNTSTSSDLIQTVNQAATIIEATASQNPVALGDDFAVEVIVRPVTSGFGIPTGTVEAYYGSTLLDSEILDAAGAATFTIANLPAGVSGIIIKYLGDEQFFVSSTALTESVTATSSITTLDSSNNPTSFGETTTFNVTVTSLAGVPTGTVALFEGTTALGIAALNDNGEAAFILSDLSVGIHDIQAIYSGSLNITGSISNVVTQIVNTSDTTTTLISYLNPASYGENIVLQATVQSLNPTTNTFTGAVSFYEDIALLGSVTIQNNGQASLILNNLAVGTHPITATYEGSTDFEASTSAVLTQTIAKTPTSINATATPNPGNLGSPITLNIEVFSIKTTSEVPTGNIEVYLGSQLLGAGTLNNAGQVAITLTDLPAGVSTIILKYSGDDHFIASTTTISETINRSLSSTDLTSSINPSKIGQEVNFIATVTSASATPSGTVSFFDGATTLATIALNSNGIASFSTFDLALGTHSVTAVYSGSNELTSSTSAIVEQVVAKSDTQSTLTSINNPSYFGQPIVVNAFVNASAPGKGISTGNVTFLNGADVLGTAPLNTLGQASLVLSDLAVGINSLTVIYNGDTNFNTSTSSPVNQTVNQSATRITASLSPNPTIFGEPVEVSVAVFPINIGTGIFPTGAIEILNGSVVVGTGMLDANGKASIDITNLPAGNTNLIVNYLGDDNYLPSSIALTETVDRIASTTTVTSSINPSVYGQLVSFNATVTSTTGIPTGFVTFLDGNTVIGTSALDNSGVALISLYNLSTGTHTIQASYEGDMMTLSSISTPLTQEVNSSDVLVELSSSENPSFFGNGVTFYASVIAATPGFGEATGTITFSDGITILDTVSLNQGGQAILSLLNLSVGSHLITATYSGDTNFNSAASLELNQVVNQAATLVLANILPNPSSLGSNLTLDVTVKPITSGFGIPTGVVEAYYGSNLLGTGTLDNTGATTFTVTGLPAGVSGIIVKYLGDTNFIVSSTALSESVTAASSLISLTSSNNPSYLNQPVTFNASVTSVTGTPTGTVAFFEGNTALGTATLNANGETSLTLTNLSVGTHAIRAIYSGSLETTSSTSNIIEQVVNAADTIISLTSTPNPSTYDAPILLSANVDVIDSEISTINGTVTFNEGSTVLGTAVTNNKGQATLALSNLLVGSHTITATFVGNNQFNTSTSQPIEQTILKAASLIQVTASANPINVGEMVTLTLNVLPLPNSLAIPTGVVEAYAGASLLGSGTLNANGSTSIVISNLPTGNNAITLHYLGDANFIDSTTVFVETVDALASTLVLVSSPNPSVFGEPVAFTATVSATASAVLGTVSFLDDERVLETVVLNNSGIASMVLTDLSVGTHTISAVYNGTDNLESSTSNVIDHVVTKSDSNTTVISGDNPTYFENSVTFYATVAATSPGAGTPTGSVTFRNDTTILGTANLNNGQAILSVADLPAGVNLITVTYIGDANFNASISPLLNQAINKSATITQAAITTDPIVVGEPITIVVAVKPIISGMAMPTGNVNVTSGGVVLATGTLDANGEVELDIASLPAGSADLTVNYLGDANFLASSTLISGIVSRVNSTTTLTTSVNPSFYGQEVTFTATVTSVGIATGLVAFSDGDTVIGIQALNNVGMATLTVANLAFGMHNITANYTGNASINESTSDVLIQNVIKTNVAVALTSLENPSFFGNAATFYATVSSDLGMQIPTGTITFNDGAVVLGTMQLNNAGQALLSLLDLAVGTHEITASYSGDVNFNTATSAELNQVVRKAATLLDANIAPNPSSLGNSLTVNSLVRPVTSGFGVPTGTVEAYYGATLVGSGTLDNTGATSFVVTGLPAGVSGIVVKYLGDANFFVASTSLSESVTASASEITLNSGNNPSSLGQPVTFDVAVTSASGIAAGTVALFEGVNALGTATLNANGQTTFTLSTLSVGTHAIRAVYSGSLNITSSISNIVNQVILPSDTEITLASLPNPAIFGATVTLTADVASVNPIVTGFTGNIIFREGTTVLGTVAVNENGQASLPLSSLEVGTHIIEAEYVDDSNFNSSSSVLLSQIVIKAATQITAAANQNPINQGDSVALNINVSSIQGGEVVPTGVVNVYAGSTLLGSGTLDSIGNTTVEVSGLTAGMTTITFQYLGDTNFIKSSTTLTETVLTSESVITLAPSSNPIVFGEPLQLNVTVTSPFGIPTGTVAFFNGVTPLGTATLDELGKTSLIVSDLPAGIHSIRAVYSGSATIKGSTSTLLNQILETADTTTTLSSFINPSVYGETVTLTANVDANVFGITVANGNVNFYEGTTLLQSVPVNNNGQAALELANLSVGTHNFTAQFSGNSNFNPSTSSIRSQIVNKAATQVQVTASPNPANIGQEVELAIQVLSIPEGTVIPTGTVTAYAGSTLLGSSTLDANALASITFSNLSAGNTTIEIYYSGDVSFNGSSITVVETVISQNSTTVLTSTPNPSSFGQQVTLTASVTVATGIPMGKITFYDGLTALATVNLNNNGEANYSLFNLSVGSHALTAVYEGTNDNLNSTSNSIQQIVNPTTATIDLTSSLNPAAYGDKVTFTAQVNAPLGVGFPTGTVTFKNGLTIIGAEALNTDGLAVLSLSNLPVGLNEITAGYEGNGNVASIISLPLTQTINPADTSTLITSSLPNPSIFGEQVTFFATVVAENAIPTGTVTFFDGPNAIGTAQIYNGLAILSTNSLAIGTHGITAVYNGTLNFNESTSVVPLIQIVNMNGLTVTTSTVVTSSLNPSTYGEPVTFDITVFPLVPGGIPTGNVELYYGSTPLVVLPLNNQGKATYTTATLPAGNLQIVAVYSGDNDFSASTQTLSQVVNPITTSTQIISSDSTSEFGQLVTFTAKITSAASIPNGTVSFYDGVNLLGTVLLDGNGLANFSTTALSTGNHQIIATYNGENNFQSSSGQLTQSVNATATFTNILSSTPNPAHVGENVTIIASTLANSGIPEGLVNFYDGNILLGTSALNNGFAIFTTSLLAAGPHNIQAIYQGNSSFNSSTSATYVQNVTQPLEMTSTNLVSSLNPANSGQLLTFTATITAATSVPTGTVTFYDGALALGNVLLDSVGKAIYSISNLAPGSHNIQAVYQGNNSYTSSNATIQQMIDAATTTTTLVTITPNPANIGETITFIASVNSETGLPTGTVSFYDGTILLGTTPIFSGLAIFTSSQLEVGAHAIQAVYNGNANYQPSTSEIYIENVKQPLYLTVTQLSSSVNPSTAGQPITLTASVVSLIGNASGTVTFFDGNEELATVAIVQGSAIFVANGLSEGAHLLTAKYNGDATHSASSSNTVEQIVQAFAPFATITEVTSSANPVNANQPFTLIASVNFISSINPTSRVSFDNELTFLGSVILVNELANLPVSGSGIKPTGRVSFYNGLTFLGSAPLVNGLANLPVSGLPVGQYAITAVYEGNAEFQSSTSLNYTEVVTAAILPTTIQLTSSRNPALQGKKVAIKAVIGSLGNPTGTVTFFDGVNAIGAVIVENGKATFITSDLNVGTHEITAYYNGDATHSPSVSNSIIQVIKVNLRPHIPQAGKVYQITKKEQCHKVASNVLTWKPPKSGPAPTHYIIYANAQLTELIGQVSAKDALIYEDKHPAKTVKFYYIVSVNEHGSSPALRVAVYKHFVHSVSSFSAPFELDNDPILKADAEFFTDKISRLFDELAG